MKIIPWQTNRNTNNSGRHAMEQNKRRTTSREWVDVLSAWRKSGESQRGYCRRAGISFSSFTYWRGKLEKESQENRLVKVGKVQSTRMPTIGNPIIVRSGAMRVELSGEESEAVLGKLFRALKAVS